MTAALGAGGRPLLLWTGAAAGSVVAHLALLWVLTVQPEPVPFKPEAERRVAVEMQDTRAERPAAENAAGTQAEARPAAATPTTGAVVRRERARPADPAGTPVAAAAVEADAVQDATGSASAPARPAAPPANRVQAVARPAGAALEPQRQAEAVRPAAPQADVQVAATGPSAAALPAARPAATPLAPTGDPAGAPLVPAAPTTARARLADTGPRVAAASPRAQAVGTLRPEGPTVSATTVASSAQPPAAPAGATLGARPAATAMAAPQVPDGTRIASVQQGAQADRLRARTQAGSRAQATAPATSRAQAAEPAADRAEAAAPSGTRAEVAAPHGTRAEVAAPHGNRAQVTAPAAAELRAALGWSGDATSRLDPQSLAAIGSFMVPKAAGDAGSVRDGLQAALASVPCSRLVAAFDPDSGRIEIRGHARDADSAARAVAGVEAAAGRSIPVAPDLLILPEPQCGVLDGIDAVGLPQSNDQTDDPLVVGRAAEARRLSLAEGAPLVLALGAADYDAWLYVDFYDAEGQVTHLTPNTLAPLRRLTTGEEISIGDGQADGSGITLTVAPPFGKDIVVALAATRRLFAEDRPITEDAGAYLAALKARVAELRAADPTFRGEWAYIFVETFARGTR